MAALYQTDQYIRNHPLLHAEDSSWKIGQILPLVDSFIGYQKKPAVTVLDVGGGAGLILKAVSMYIENEHNVKANKIALDLSHEMLERQKRENPDLKRALNEDIRKTSLNNKEIGPDRDKFKGWINFIESYDSYSIVRVRFENRIIREGDIVSDIKSDNINGRQFKLPQEVWASLKN